jgi:hypothetical protein
MKTRGSILWAALALAPCLAVGTASAADPSLAGNWVTDAVIVARQMQAQLKEALKQGDLEFLEELEEEDSVMARAYRNQVAANPQLSPINRNTADRSGGGAIGGGGPRSGGGARTGGGGTGGGGFGGGTRGGRGNNFLPAGRQEKQEKKASATTSKTSKTEADVPKELSGPAITMELKVSKNKVTGNITEILADDLSDQKLKIEDGTIEGAKFKFVTYKKAGGIELPIYWTGEIASEKTIYLTRKLTSGKSLDEVEKVTFTRIK